MVIHYRVNASPPPGQSLTPEQIVQAFRMGAEAWTAVDPKVSIIFDGTTTEQPTGYNNVVGFAPSDTSQAAIYPLTGEYTTAFNIIMSSKDGWDFNPCKPPATPCDRYRSSKALDLLDVVTHEWGHVLGLAHVPDTELTMYDGNSQQVFSLSRKRVSLGLGDVLGLREMYPCGCPMPSIHAP